MRRLIVLVTVAVMSALGVVTRGGAAAQATTPGKNGPIAFSEDTGAGPHASDSGATSGPPTTRYLRTTPVTTSRRRRDGLPTVRQLAVADHRQGACSQIAGVRAGEHGC
jgi:hypothetical protein